MLMSIFKPKWMLLILGLFFSGAVYKFAPYQSNWQPASSAFDKDRLYQVFTDNAKSLIKTTAPDNAKVKYIRPFAAPELAIVDFNTEDVCGFSGCLYAIYQTNQPAQPIFRWLLHSKDLPPNIDLFSTDKSCLVLNQTNNRGQISQIHFCYSSDSYKQTSQSVFPAP
jgi:hypothetical protein